MTLRLLDSITLPGDPEKPNEDAYGIGANAAVVMDGATNLGPSLLPGPSDAAWIAQFGARRLMAHLADGDAPRDALRHALGDAEKSFAGLSRKPIREKWQTPTSSMMLVAAAGEGRRGSNYEALWFGDCGALLDQQGVMTVVGNAFDSRGAESARAAKIAKEKNLAPAAGINRPEFLNQLRASRNRINSGSNWRFSPDVRAAAHAGHKSLTLAPGTLLLLASDGFLALATDYGIYDAAGLLQAARHKGLKAVAEELRVLEDADPLGENFPRFKKSDDSTALLLEVS